MTRRTFADSHLVPWQDLTFEIIDHQREGHAERLGGIRDEVLEVAARSRGWDDDDSLALFRRTFKIGPLYAANALVLVYADNRLVGLAGTVNDWPVDDGSIVHLCSLGLMPQVQRRGLLPVFMSLLWIASLRHPRIARDLARGALYTTAITQSPLILGLMQRIAGLYPSPERTAPRPDEARVARAVLARFDPDVAFEPATFVLRHECEFRYRRLPASTDRHLTRLCAEQLRFDEGDAFVVVGTVVADRLTDYLARQRALHGPLLATVLAAIDGAPSPDLAIGHPGGTVPCVRSA